MEPPFPEHSRLIHEETHLPVAIPGETLYNWCGRYHRLSGVTDARRTSRVLFGQESIGLRHDFPAGLAYFQHATNRALGAAEDIVRSRTVFGFFAPFLSDAAKARFLTMQTGQERQSPRRILGLARFGLPVPNPLKACAECVNEELKERPFAHWNIVHQWPTVGTCAKHQLALQIVRDELQLPEVRTWHLPSDIEAPNWIPVTTPSADCLQIAGDLQRWTREIVSRSDLSLDEGLLRWAYRLQAKERKWTAMDGSVRLRELRDAFDAEYGGLASFPTMAFLANTTGVNAGFLGMLFREYRGARHPAKHIALMRFLFREPEPFFALYESIATADRNGELSSIEGQLKDVQQQLTDLVGTQRVSVNAASKTLGLITSQATRFLRNAGVAYEKRPRIVGTETEPRLVAMLERGTGRSAIVKRLGVRPNFIKDFLATRPDLREQWEQQHFERQRLAHRLRFQRTLERNPGVPIKRIRRLPHNGFEWLYRNDREWLASVLPAIWRREP